MLLLWQKTFKMLLQAKDVSCSGGFPKSRKPAYRIVTLKYFFAPLYTHQLVRTFAKKYNCRESNIKPPICAKITHQVQSLMRQIKPDEMGVLADHMAIKPPSSF